MTRNFGDDELQRLYKKAEFNREHKEVKKIEKRIRSLVDEISVYIGRKDPLFKNFVIPSGSFYEDLKVEGPDEFDFMICLEQLSSPGVCVTKDIPMRPVPDPGYVDVQLSNEDYRNRWQRHISRRGNLKPDVLLRRFKQLVEKAIANQERSSRDELDEYVNIQLRKIPITIKVRWHGKKYSNYEVAVDLTLCIKMSGWPDASDIKKRVSRGHPGYEAFREAVAEGYHLVASTIGESGKPRPCWRLSFSIPERVILKHICKNPKLIHKVTLKVLKVLRKENEDFLCLFESPGDELASFHITWVFHSYVLKTMLLREWTDFPEDSYWTKNQLGKRVKSILERIRSSVVRKDIQSFWVPGYKLFNFRARKPTNTKHCVDNLGILLDKLDLSKCKHVAEFSVPKYTPKSQIDIVTVDPVDFVDPTEFVDPVDFMDPIDPVDATDFVDSMDPVDPVDFVDPTEFVDPVDFIDTTDLVDFADPIDFLDPVDFMDPIDPVDTIGFEDFIDPVDPIDLVDPSDFVDPVDFLDL